MTRRDVLCFSLGILFTVGGLTGAAKLADVDRAIDRLGGQMLQLNGLRMEVNRLNDRAGFNVKLDPDLEHADLRRWSRRDAADNLHAPDDRAEFAGQRDSFDRRPAAGVGVKP